MAEIKNGNGWMKWIVRILICFILTTAGSIMWFHETKISANDKASIARDDGIKKEHQDDRDEQQKINEDTGKSLTKIQTDVGWIRKYMEKNG